MYTSEIPIPTPEQAQHILSQFELQPNGCYYWTGGVQGAGYGIVGYNYMTYLVHRVVWTIRNGPIPEGMILLHSCEKNYLPGDQSYRRCGNLEHLVLGTFVDNARDRIANGRERKGDQSGCNNPMAFLCKADI